MAKTRPFGPIIPRSTTARVQSTSECAMTRTVMSICAGVIAPSPTYGRSVPNASECMRTPMSSPESISSLIRSRAASILPGWAAFMLKKWVLTPRASSSSRIVATRLRPARRSRWTPKTWYPPAAIRLAHASPKPLDAPRMSAHRPDPLSPDMSKRTPVLEGMARVPARAATRPTCGHDLPVADGVA